MSCLPVQKLKSILQVAARHQAGAEPCSTPQQMREGASGAVLSRAGVAPLMEEEIMNGDDGNLAMDEEGVDALANAALLEASSMAFLVQENFTHA